MRIAIATAQVPFIRGGAEMMTAELYRIIQEYGHSVEIVTVPFRFNPVQEISRCMEYWASESFDSFDCGSVDKVICLKFPAFYLKHHDKTIWLMHQHRSVYELFDTDYGESSHNPDTVKLREEIIRRDTLALRDAKEVYTISRRVSERMKYYNGVESSSIYQPPRLSNQLCVGDQLPYIFFPSRLESLKRQELLIRSAKHIRSQCVVLISGDGGQRSYLESLISDLNLNHKVRLLGNISDNEMIKLYSNALGVFFGPYDEDYGFVTLEAMLSGKPVITCTDSGGPLEFVVDEETGYVVEPKPEAIAEAIERLFTNRTKARNMGLAGLRNYQEMQISWKNVYRKLLNIEAEVFCP